ncbi:hypothetical protein [Solidesulfovibrio sp.]
MSGKKVWNSLEVTKIVVSLLTPLLLFWIGFVVNKGIREVESNKIAEQKRVESIRSRQQAVQSFSKYIYERRARAELLSSSLRRHEKSPLAESYNELILRKRLYDDAYFNWNANSQANLFLIRQILQDDQYTVVEDIVEKNLILNILRPLDACLTQAYDNAIRGGDPAAILDNCDSKALLANALDCGYAVTDELYKLTTEDKTYDISSAKGIIEHQCRAMESPANMYEYNH